MNQQFTGGFNIALKIPKAAYDKTVAFYRDILKLEVKEEPIDNPTVSRTHSVVYGPNTIWLDCVDNYTHSDVWLELFAPDITAATEYLRSNGIATQDEFEQIPVDKHLITDPAGVVINLSAPERAGAYTNVQEPSKEA